MQLTARHVFIELPKAASRYVVRALGGEPVPGLGGHHPAWLLPGEYREGRTVFGVVRDPWTWYVSWWAFSVHNNPSVPGVQPFGGKRFKQCLYGATHIRDVPVSKERPSGITAMVPGAGDRMKECGWGLATFMLAYTHGALEAHRDGEFGTWGVDYLVLQDDLDTGLKAIGAGTLGHRINSRRERGGAPFVSHDPRELYDDEMLEWVAEADAELIDMFDLRPFEPSGASVVHVAVA